MKDSITMNGDRDAAGLGISPDVSSVRIERPTPKNWRISASSTYEIDVERRMVSVKFRKKVTVREIEKYAALLRANPLFEPDFSEIVDMTDVEELDLSADEFIRLADKVDPFSPEAKRAFVVRNSVQSHAARMHKILRTESNFSIFYSVAQAKEWLLAGPGEESQKTQNSK